LSGLQSPLRAGFASWAIPQPQPAVSDVALLFLGSWHVFFRLKHWDKAKPPVPWFGEVSDTTNAVVAGANGTVTSHETGLKRRVQPSPFHSVVDGFADAAMPGALASVSIRVKSGYVARMVGQLH
jgi:hypothetical protein